MNHILTLFVLIFTLTSVVEAQSPKFIWAKRIGTSNDENPGSIVCDGSGQLYLNGHNGDGPFVYCLDADGNLVWERKYGGRGYGISIDLDDQGNVYFMGSFPGTISFDPPQNNYTLTANNWNVYVSKLDQSGNCVMAARLGGNGETFGYGMDVDKVGNVYSTGSFTDTADFDPGPNIYSLIADSLVDWLNNPPEISLYDVFLSKLSASGSFTWADDFGGKYGDRGRAVCVDEHENVYSLGYFENNANFDKGDYKYPLTSEGEYDVFLTKRNRYGHCVWVKQWDIRGININHPMVLDSEGSIYITGWFTGTVDFDPGPNTELLTSVGEDDTFVLKLDTNGNFIWVNRIGGLGTDRGNSIALDASGNIYIAGSFSGNSDFDPGPGTFNLTSKGERDIYVVKIDEMRGFKWAIQLDGSGLIGSSGNYSHENLSLATDLLENLYVLGPFSGTADLDPSPTELYFTSDGYKDMFLLKLSSETITSSSTNLFSNVLRIFPNPAQNSITILGQSSFVGAHYNIIDINGIKIVSGQMNEPSTLIDISAFKCGLYFVEIKGTIYPKMRFIKN